MTGISWQQACGNRHSDRADVCVHNHHAGGSGSRESCGIRYAQGNRLGSDSRVARVRGIWAAGVWVIPINTVAGVPIPQVLGDGFIGIEVVGTASIHLEGRILEILVRDRSNHRHRDRHCHRFGQDENAVRGVECHTRRTNDASGRPRIAVPAAIGELTKHVSSRTLARRYPNIRRIVNWVSRI